MKKPLKVIATIFGVLVFAFLLFVVLLVRKLPSAWEIKQSIAPKSIQIPEFVKKDSAALSGDVVTAEKPAELPAKTQEEKVDDSKARSLKVLKEDFMNEQKPLSSVCANLAMAEKSHFLRKDDSGSANEFMKSLSENDQKDPLVESAAPLFRFLFRIESMKSLVDSIEKASAENDQGFFKKAEFYTKMGLAAQAIRGNKANIDRILMKSYNLYILSRAVGKHPELARDPATLNFCDQIEKNINLNLDYNPDEQSAELMKFLEYAKVDPKEVDFDPSYRSNVNFDISNSSVHLQNIWIEKLFEKDIAKAQKRLKKDSTEAPASSDY